MERAFLQKSKHVLKVITLLLTNLTRRIFEIVVRPLPLVILSFGLIFSFSYAYIENSVVRLRCHEPSFENVSHFSFEVLPIIFLVLVIFGCIWTSYVALKSSQSVFHTLCVVLLAFTYSVCCFALIYLQYGLLEVPSAEDIAFLQLMMLQELLKSGSAITPDLDIIKQGIFIGDFEMRFHETGIEASIVQDAQSYFLYSLSTILPAVPTYSTVKLCPSAYYFGVAQSFTNVVMGLLTVVLVARVSSIATEQPEISEET